MPRYSHREVRPPSQAEQRLVDRVLRLDRQPVCMVEALGSDPIDEGIGRVNVCSPFGLQSLQVPSALAAAECGRMRAAG
jgi:hypothetical protein